MTNNNNKCWWFFNEIKAEEYIWDINFNVHLSAYPLFPYPELYPLVPHRIQRAPRLDGLTAVSLSDSGWIAADRYIFPISPSFDELEEVLSIDNP
jgi:hypothetical protein